MYGTWFGVTSSVVLAVLLVFALAFSAWMPIVGVLIALLVISFGVLVMSLRRPHYERTGSRPRRTGNDRTARDNATQTREAGGFPAS
jgi:hypothetical protein